MTSTISISQIFLLVTWFSVAILLFILALIARFYEQFAKKTTYYRWYAVPVLVLGSATARYVSLDQWGGDIIGDALLFGGGIMLTVLCYHLYRQMTRSRE